jgi:ABC-type glycerol-3-phosphate transport system substrate-binding protein
VTDPRRWDPTRRTFLLGAAATLGVPALAACGTASTVGSASSTAQLEYLVIGDQDWMSRATADLAAFAATDPGFTVTTRYLTGADYDDEAAQRVFAADPPDLLWHNVSRSRFADLVTAGATTDLSDLWARALPGAGPAVADWYTFHGRRPAVPLDLVLYPVICYDAALFRRLGITPPPAGTRSWPEAEFLAASATLHAAGLDPLAVGGVDLPQQLVEAIAVTMLSQAQLRHYAVDAWQPGSPYRYTDEGWTQVFVQLQKWVRAHVFPPRAAWVDQVSAQRAFVGGVAGMVAGGSWTVRRLRQLAAGAGASLDLDWMLFPTITHPSRLLTSPGDGVCIPASSTQRGRAEQVLAFMLRPDRMTAAAKAYGHLPPVNLPGLAEVLDPQVTSMLEVSTRLGAPCLNLPTELEAPFARACRAVLAGTSTPGEAGQDVEDAASLARAAGG